MRCDVPEGDVYRLVRQYVAAWNSHDVDRLTSLFGEEGSYGEFGLGRVMLGQEEIRRHLIATFDALPDLTMTPTGEPLSSDEGVLWKWLMTATHEGEFAGVHPTGKRFELRGVCVLLIREDEVARATDCFDVADLVRQVAPESELGCNSDDRSTANPWLATFADEDNIGYGE